MLRLSSQVSGFALKRLSFGLGNGFKLEEGEIIFDSDATGKSRAGCKTQNCFKQG